MTAIEAVAELGFLRKAWIPQSVQRLLQDLVSGTLLHASYS
jgi:hypothetical protein